MVLNRPMGVALLLALHFALAVSSVREKTATSDEPIHLATGVAFWQLEHHRLNPEGGTLTQAWSALPFALEGAALPEPDHASWSAEHWRFKVPEAFLHDLGNDSEKLLARARAMTALSSVVFGWLVWLTSRRLFGDLGAWISLALYCFSPTVLAHSRLVTADLGLALFLVAAVTSLWRVMHTLSLRRVGIATLAISGVVLTKMSGALIAPIAAVLLTLRVAFGRPLRILGPRQFEIAGQRWRVAVVLIAALMVMALGVWGATWAVYGFHYAGDPQSETSVYEWSEFEAPGVVPVAVRWAADRRLLPEAYLFGFLYTWYQAQARLAFLDGEVSPGGWIGFFPLAFLYKTPLAVMAVAALAVGVGLLRLRRGGDDESSGVTTDSRLYDAIPLLGLIAVYGGTAIAGNLNIGHRHILAIYPAIFILCGAVGPWLFEGSWRRARLVLVGGLLGLLVFDAFRIWPHYLAYFNPIAGGPAQGYRHLVDSSLDWGQDLKLLGRWLEENELRGIDAPDVYLAYFGPTRPEHYGIEASLLPGYPYPLIEEVEPQELGAGVYCVSASILQVMWLRTNRNPGSEASEARYRELDRLWRALRLADVPAERDRLKAEYLERVRARLARRDRPGDAAWVAEIEARPKRAWRRQQKRARLELADLQLARLLAHLRKREPDHQVGYSILIYFVDDEQIRQALSADVRAG